MQTLFAISILSFLVLLWAALAITRRIRASHNFERPQPAFSQDLFAAAEATDHFFSHAASQPLSPDSSASNWAAHPNNIYDKATSTELG